MDVPEKLNICTECYKEDDKLVSIDFGRKRLCEDCFIYQYGEEEWNERTKESRDE